MIKQSQSFLVWVFRLGDFFTHVNYLHVFEIPLIMYRLKASRHPLPISQVSFHGYFHVPGKIADGCCRWRFRRKLPNTFTGNFIYSKGSWSFGDTQLVIHGST